jgi:carboxypeptidase family protein/TonB-dependent receptor-like protein
MRVNATLVWAGRDSAPGTRCWHFLGGSDYLRVPRCFGLVVCILSATLLWIAKPLIADENKPQPKEVETVLSGQVRDTSGEPISNAKVIVDEIHTNDRHTTLSTRDGNFNIARIPPGEYRLLITAAGYKTFSIPRLPLVAGDHAKANAVMELGSASEKLQGSGESVVSRAGTALAGKSVSDLPENQRNFVNVVQVSGGANEGSTNEAASGSRPGAQDQSSAVSLGGQPESTNNSLIDGIDNNDRINSQIAVHPSIEGVGEMQILASAYPASFGHAGGGVINVITKSGTDRLHGSGYEYFRNDVLDTFPFQFGARNPKPELRQNQFGGSLGGPLRRGKTYFFGDYEAFRLIQARAPLKLTVPTAYEEDHPGDFTDIAGPLLTKLDAVGLAYFRLYPKPNVPGSQDLFVGNANGSNCSHVGDLRIDHRISTTDQLFGRFSYNRTFTYIPGEFPQKQEDGMTIEPGGSLSSFPGNMDDAAANIALEYSHVFSSRLSLDLKMGYTFWREADTGINAESAVNRGFGQPGINLPSTSNGLAPIIVNQAAPLGTDGYYRPINQADNTFQYDAAASWNHGKHGVTFGASLIRRDWRDIGSSSGLGTWVVNDLPSLLEGQFLQVQRQVDLVNVHYQSWEPSTFVEDQWKVLPKLSPNVGARYDLFTPPVETQNRLSNFDLSTGKIIVAGQGGVSMTAGVKTDYTDITPRLGFNWNVFQSSSISGGYGIVYCRPLDGFAYQAQPFVYSFGICSSLTCPDGFTSLAAGLPFTANPGSNDPSGNFLGTRAFDFHNSYMQQVNVGLEQRFGSDTMKIFYMGSLGRHIARFFPDINAPPPNTSVNPDPLRPFYSEAPNLTSVGYVDTEASSSYNALQASFAHSSHYGLTTQLNYTWAHGLDDAGGGGFGTVPLRSSQMDYGNSGFDVRQRFAASAFYQLPFGKGINGPKGLITKGWQLNLSAVWSTGLPFTVLNATDMSNTNPGASGGDRPNQIAKVTLDRPGVGRFFNTAAFVAQVPGTLGDERSNQLYGPHNRRVDASIFKTFSIGKESTLQFRTEIFNLTNTANFASPASVLGGANFGQLTQLTAGYTPREIQLAIRVQF